MQGTVHLVDWGRMGDLATESAGAAAVGAPVRGLFAQGDSNVTLTRRQDIERIYKIGCFGSSASTNSLKPLFMRSKRR